MCKAPLLTPAVSLSNSLQTNAPFTSAGRLRSVPAAEAESAPGSQHLLPGLRGAEAQPELRAVAADRAGVQGCKASLQTRSSVCGRLRGALQAIAAHLGQISDTAAVRGQGRGPGSKCNELEIHSQSSY